MTVHIHIRRPANQIGTEPSTLSLSFLFSFFLIYQTSLTYLSSCGVPQHYVPSLPCLSIPSLFLLYFIFSYQPSFTPKGTIRRFRHWAPMLRLLRHSIARSKEVSKYPRSTFCSPSSTNAAVLAHHALDSDI